MNRQARIVGYSVLALLATVGTFVSFAGPLDPPAGAIVSTHKTLTEVEPRIAINQANTPGVGFAVYRISQPGSYYLTGNLTGQNGKMTLEVAANDVSIDLMGFTVQGVAGSDLAISTFAPYNNVSIRNGKITGPGDGIILSLFGAGVGGVIENVEAWDVGGVGIAPNASSVVRNCTATDCSAGGIGASDDCIVESCTVRGNAGRGITTATGSIVRNCAAYQNGSEGIFTGNRSSVLDCVTLGNGGGITVATGSIVRGNFCSNNTSAAGNAAGILCTGSDNRVEGNNCTAGNRGIRATSVGNFIVRNTCSGNAINWDIVSGNALAPIVGASTNAAAVSGNTYAGTLGSTDPNANFSY